VSSILSSIRLLIADRNFMGSQLLAEALDRDPRFEAFAVTTLTSTDILLASSAHEPRVAVISADLDGVPRKGLQIARALNAHYRNVHIVILIDASAPESVIAAFRCGAKGVFCRTKPMTEFFACIERVSQGEIWANSVETEYLLEAVRNVPSCHGIENEGVRTLSKREIQVAERAAQGYSNKQIATEFLLSEHTVKNYLARVFEKLGVSNRCELLFLLFKEGNGLASRALGQNVSALGNPMELHLKAAEEGYAASQFIVGVAHLEGSGVEKDGHAAYYWLRMAEENSSAVRHRSRVITEDLRAKIGPDAIDRLEKSIASRPRKIIGNNSATFFAQPLPSTSDRQAG
jgi:two-component system nitrate/nitrite response regulator NarL